MKSRYFFFLPALVWLTISVILLTLPGTAFPKNDLFDKIGFDKCIHIAMFGAMVVLACWALAKQKKTVIAFKKYFILVAIGCFAYGIAMEFVQEYLVINRSFDVGDIIADGVGCAAGLWFSVRRFIKK